MYCRSILFLFFSFMCHAQDQNDFGQPFIFNYSESVRPGEVLGLQGARFGADAQVQFALVKGTEKKLKPGKQLAALTRSEMYVAVRIPENEPMGLYAVWVTNENGSSEPVFINRARAMTSEFDEIMPGGVFRLFGRNLWLTGAKTTVSLIDPDDGSSQEAKVMKGDPYEIVVVTPENVKQGVKYRLLVSNGYGGDYGNSYSEDDILIRQPGVDPFELDVPWGTDFNFFNNIYNVKTDSRLNQHARGDGQSNDRSAIQEAIDRASRDGGGVVYLPAGDYKLMYAEGSGITMQSRVVLKGDGRDKTIIKYGYGKPFGTERVKAVYGWVLGWPDSRKEGMGMVWSEYINTAGLIDLGLVNVNESGEFLHTIKNMPEGGSKVMLKNCFFDLSTLGVKDSSDNRAFFKDRKLVFDCRTSGGLVT